MSYSARVILDSIAPCGKRLVTVEATYPRMVHAELLTHKRLSRNSSSSRAIPIAKMIEQVRSDPAMLVHWGRNQKGMQAETELSGEALTQAKEAWLAGRDHAVTIAQQLADLGAHKQIANRVLEPWMWITVLISATEWDNFFLQRCHKDAQPEIRRAADFIYDAMARSRPRLLKAGEWHTPLILDDEIATLSPTLLCKISAGRCARISYLTHDGRRDIQADLALADRLTAASPGHWSPLEHVAEALASPEPSGNFIGWKQYRKCFAGESGASCY